MTVSFANDIKSRCDFRERKIMVKIIDGKFNSAKIYTDVVDSSAVEQVQAMCDNPIFKNSRIRILSDAPTGTSCAIGTTMTIEDKTVPNMVGVDIGCGMEVVQLEEDRIDLEQIDSAIYERILSGMEIRNEPHKYAQKVNLKGLRCYGAINEHRAECSIGTLGGGNHFIEADCDDEGRLYLVVHSGSRYLGKQVAEYYQSEAYKNLCGNSKRQIEELIARLKSEGRVREIQEQIVLAYSHRADIDVDEAYVSGQLFDDYIHDMKIVQDFAVLNRKAIIDELVGALGLTVADMFTTIHNYIDTDTMILRKGAVSAQKGEKLLIPINVRDGALICIGKGNADWNFSAPHGAGRLLSRGKAHTILSMDEFRKSMTGIYSTSINEKTLDESPMAYKRIEDIVENILPTVDIVSAIKPIYNFKAST